MTNYYVNTFGDKNTIEQLKRELSAKKIELSEYEDDFILLTDQQVILTQMLVVCDSVYNTAKGICYSLDNVTEVANNPNIYIPGLKDVVDFDDIKSGVVKSIETACEHYDSTIRSVCAGIDAAKKECSDNIRRLNARITQLQGLIG
jgi:hypothetical protein